MSISESKETDAHIDPRDENSDMRSQDGSARQAIEPLQTQQEVAPEKQVSSPPAVPDGGWHAWMTVVGCGLAFFSSFGFVTGFGVFQAYYEAVLPTSSSADISWIGSFQLWCITGMAIPSVILSAHIGPHATLAIGTFLTVFGVMMASLATKYYQILLSHGICCGLGIGLTFLPIIGLPNQWFSTKRGLAVGLAVGGSSIGGVIWPVIVNQMINYDNVGYGWTMRTVGFVQLATMSAAIALIRTNIPRNRAVKLSSFPFVSAIKTPSVALMAVALLLHFFGIYIPYFYVSIYTQALGASAYAAFWVSAVLNAATFFGRMAMGALSDRLGHSNTLLLSVLLSAIIAYAWQGVTTRGGAFAWAVFYGWFSGASISLQSPAIIPLVPEPKLRLIGPYIAILCQLSSFGSLAGAPVAGALLHDRAKARHCASLSFQPADFHSMMWFTGTILLGAALFYQAACYVNQPKLFGKD